MGDLIDAANALDQADEELDRKITKLETNNTKPIPIFPPVPPIEC